MHTVQAALPHPRLLPYVRCFAQREMSLGNAVHVQPSIASLEYILSFDLCDRPVMNYSDGRTEFIPRVHLVGTQTYSMGNASYTGHVLAFGIFLTPFAVWQLFRIPPAELADSDFEAQDVLGSWIQDLWFKLTECPSFPHRIRAASEALFPFIDAAVSLSKVMATAPGLFQTDPETRILNLARESYMSIRNYERRFVAEMGISPKLFARVARFQRALDHKRMTGETWLEVAQKLGYFDQMHMVRDFRAFGGETPSRLIQTSGDFQPWSIDCPSKR